MGSSDNRELVPESRFVWRAHRPGHTHRLICFPHAGAGASAFAEWAKLLPEDIELVAVQLPGRQNRIGEEPFRDVGRLTTALRHALRPVLEGRYAFFGHSGGAIAAYELARALAAAGEGGPEHLFVSAQPAPDVPPVRVLHELPDDAFRAELIALGGIDPEIAAMPEVMEMLLGLLRTDFRLWEGYRPTSPGAVDCPVTALSPDADPRAPRDAVRGWQVFTTAGFRLRTFSGGHFYLYRSAADVVAAIRQELLDPTTDRRVA